MTIDQLRKNITVKTWMIDTDGIDISYSMGQSNANYSIFIPQRRSAQLLSSVGEIEIKSENPLQILFRGKELVWEEFALRYKLCQWEALRIAIAYEYEKALEKDMNLLEIDEALKALQ